MPRTKRRNRARENAGSSPRSWHKHDTLRRAIDGQVSAFLVRWPGSRALLIDGNAGDGAGATKDQLDLFSENVSQTTAAMLMRFAANRENVDVLLCERDAEKRAILSDRFPGAGIVSDHARAPELLTDQYGYALWLSDPCGPADQGMEPMQRVSSVVAMADFVIVFNEGALDRMLAEPGSDCPAHIRAAFDTMNDRYAPMRDPRWWATELNRHHLSRTPLYSASQSFRYRIMAVANYLSDAARRTPFEVIL